MANSPDNHNKPRKRPLTRPGIPIKSTLTDDEESYMSGDTPGHLPHKHPLDIPNFITDKSAATQRGKYPKHKPATRPGLVPKGPRQRGVAEEAPEHATTHSPYEVPQLQNTDSNGKIIWIAAAALLGITAIIAALLLTQNTAKNTAQTQTQPGTTTESPEASRSINGFIADLPGRDSNEINLGGAVNTARLMYVIDFAAPALTDFGAMPNRGSIPNPDLPYFGEPGQGSIKDSFMADGTGQAIFRPDPDTGSFRSIDIPDVDTGLTYLRWDLTGWEFANDNASNTFSWGFRSANGKELLIDLAVLEQTNPDICRIRVNNNGRLATIGDNLGLTNSKRFSIVLALDMTERTYSVMIGDGLSKKYIKAIVDAKLDSSFDIPTHIRFSAFGNAADDRINQNLLAYGQYLETILSL